MHPRASAPLFILALALAACEDQTAQTPTTPPPATQSEQQEARAPQPEGSASAPTTTTTPAPASTPTREAAEVRPPAGGEQSGASSAPGITPYQGRTFSAGPMSLQLNADRTFVMDESQGNRRVEGSYTYQNGVLTFSDARGDIGPAQFPMRCRFQPSGADEFRLGAEGQSCTRFEDMTFRATG